jgi:hypothetical protein
MSTAITQEELEAETPGHDDEEDASSFQRTDEKPRPWLIKTSRPLLTAVAAALLVAIAAATYG